jgi:hypothetical protein
MLLPLKYSCLIGSLSHHKEKEKITKRYEIGNETLASLAVLVDGLRWEMLWLPP